MLATVRRLSFHYTPLPTKYLYDPPPDRHRLTTYAKIKLEKIAPERILSKRWGSWVSLTFIGLGFVVAIVSVLDLFPNFSEGAESRVWSSKNGYSTEAEFIGFNSEHKVVLRLKDGRVKEIALSVLSDADQEYIHRQTAKKDAAPTNPPATSAAPSTVPATPAMPDTQGTADPATAPDVTSAAQNSAKDVGHSDLKRALSAVREQVKECRTPEETLALYDMLLGHTGLPAEVRQQAEEDRAEWKRKADDGLVRFGSKWSNQSEVPRCPHPSAIRIEGRAGTNSPGSRQVGR